MNFKPGDIVRLNSGGPQMTVVNHDRFDGVKCNYFTKDDEDKVGYFNSETIHRIKDKPFSTFSRRDGPN